MHHIESRRVENWVLAVDAQPDAASAMRAVEQHAVERVLVEVVAVDHKRRFHLMVGAIQKVDVVVGGRFLRKTRLREGCWSRRQRDDTGK